MKNPKNDWGVTQVEIYNPYYERAKAKAESINSNGKEFINDLILMQLEKDEFMKRYAPKLHVTYAGPDKMNIENSDEPDRIAAIILKQDKLICLQDNSDCCIHVRFALASLELRKLLVAEDKETTIR